MLRIDSNQLFVLASQLGTQRTLKQSMERLSTGLRINRASDDAAGLAVSEQMRTQVRGTAQANRNVEDGLAYYQIADGTLGETQNALQRMRELAVKAQNDTLTSTDRGFMQLEFHQLASEVKRTLAATQYDGQEIFNGTLTSTLTDLLGPANKAVNSITVNDTAAAGQIKSGDVFTITRLADNIATRNTPFTIDSQNFTYAAVVLAPMTQVQLDSSTGVHNPVDEWDGLPAETIPEGSFGAGIDFVAGQNNYFVYNLPEGATLGAQAPLTYGADYTFTNTDLILAAGQDPGGPQIFDVAVENRYIAMPGVLTQYAFNATQLVYDEGGGGEQVLTAGVHYNLDYAGQRIQILDAGRQFFRGGPGGERVSFEYLQGPAFNLPFNMATAPGNYLEVKRNGAAVALGNYAFHNTWGLSFTAGGGGPLTAGETVTVNYVRPYSLPDPLVDVVVPSMVIKNSGGNTLPPAGYMVNGFDQVLFQWNNNLAAGGFCANGENLTLTYDTRTYKYHITGGDQDAGTYIDTDFFYSNPRAVLPGITLNLNQWAAAGDVTTLAFDTADSTLQVGPNAATQDTQALFRQSIDYIFGNIESLSIDGHSLHSSLTDSRYAWTELVLNSTGNNGTGVSSALQKTWVQYNQAMANVTAIRVQNTTNRSLSASLKPSSDATFLNTAASDTTGQETMSPWGYNTYAGTDLLRTDATGFRLYELNRNDVAASGDLRVYISTQSASVFTTAAREELQRTISDLDSRIRKVSTVRADLGSMMNRLEHTRENNATMELNMASAESGIRDADMALEMTQFTRAQILQQASYSMLAQANSSSQLILQLLGVG